MKCPVCKDVTLLMTEKNGVEVDYCPECRGIWLDRGELDKIIKRAQGARSAYYEEERREHADDRRREERSYDRKREEERYYKEHRKKKSSPISALSDIMEIFGGE